MFKFHFTPLLRALAFCLVGASACASVPADFDAANRLYDQSDFKGARAGYETLIASGDHRANLFYNLGNAAFRLGDKSAAFLAYERALALEPGHPEAQANLRFLREETGAKLPASPWYAQAFSWPSGNAAAWLAAGAFWGLCLSVAPRLWKRQVALAPAVFCALAFGWGGAVVAWQNSQGDLWIVTAASASARTAPADGSPEQLALPMGSHVRLLQERGAWVHVRLPDDATGWLPLDKVSPVRLAAK